MSKKDIEHIKEPIILDAIMNKVQFGLVLMDNKARIIWANNRFQQWFGNLKSLVGKPCESLTKKEKKYACIKTLKSKKIESGLAYGITLKTRGIFFETITIPIFDSKGKIKHIIGQITDITESKKRQEDLMASERKYKYLVENANSLILKVDIKGRIIFLNEFAEKFFGYKKEELIGKSVVGTIMPKRLMSVAKKVCANPEKYSQHEHINMTKDGREVFIAWTNKPIYQNGKCVGVIRIGNDLTERRKAEEKLEETTNYLESLFNYANAPIIVWDKKFRITRFNHAFEHLTGWNANDIIGKKLHILFPQKSRQESLGEIERTLAGEYWKSVEIPILHKNGDARLALWNSANIYAKDGKTIIATIAQGQEITERKQAEENLRETTNYLESLFNYANAPIIVWDKKFRITRFNHAFEHLTGWNAKDIIGKKLHILFPKESRKESLSKIAGTSVGEYWKSVEIPILHKDGDVRLALWNSANICAEDGKTIIATIAQGQEITERKQVEEDLKKSEIKFRALYEGSQDGYARIDMNYQIHEFNSSFPEMLGYTEKELLGKNYLVFFSPKKCHPIEEKIFKRQVIKRGYSDLYEKEFIRKDGTIFPAQMRAYLIKDKDGKPKGIWGFIRDITEIREAESKIRVYAKELERRVKERTKELNKINQQLLERVNELERFHDLTVGRELKMIELKKQIKKLESDIEIDRKKDF
ncbi:MAG: PAS domain S-box protein [Nanoarchaeota archaeon]|nr:PAS domain S-box protein [Nanoarchaeota archaeon]